jgi:hypothetical protein
MTETIETTSGKSAITQPSCGKTRVIPTTLPAASTVGAPSARRSYQLGNRFVAKWSEMLICSWLGLDIMVNPFSPATTAEVRVRASLLADIQFRYPLAFCASADSGVQ